MTDLKKEEVATVKKTVIQLANEASKGQRIAMLLRAIEDDESAFSVSRLEHKTRQEILRGELAKIREEILTGQESLPLEPNPAPEKAA